MGQELVKAIEASWNSGNLLREVNNTLIALIPKDTAFHLDDYHPISLCNRVYKVMTKAMANRLKKILSDIISDKQTGFVLGRSILKKPYIPYNTLKNNDGD